MTVYQALPYTIELLVSLGPSPWQISCLITIVYITESWWPLPVGLSWSLPPPYFHLHNRFWSSLLFGTESYTNLLCILTTKQVLCMPFAGQNHVFEAKTTFSIFFSIDKTTLPFFFHQKMLKKCIIKGGLPALRCYYWKLVDTLKLVDSWGKYAGIPPFMHVFCVIVALSFIFSLFFPSVMEKTKKFVLTQKQMIFDQPTACRAPLHWLKYTTQILQCNEV